MIVRLSVLLFTGTMLCMQPGGGIDPQPNASSTEHAQPVIVVNPPSQPSVVRMQKGPSDEEVKEFVKSMSLGKVTRFLGRYPKSMDMMYDGWSALGYAVYYYILYGHADGYYIAQELLQRRANREAKNKLGYRYFTVPELVQAYKLDPSNDPQRLTRITLIENLLANTNIHVASENIPHHEITMDIEKIIPYFFAAGFVGLLALIAVGQYKKRCYAR